MIGQVVESRRSFPVGAFLFLLVGAGLLVLAAALRNGHVAVGACLPLFIAAALALTRSRPLAFEFTETGLEPLNGSAPIPYETFETVVAPARPGDPDKPGPRRYPIKLIHESGTLHIPAKLNVPSDEVFRFLLSTFSVSGSPKVNADLRDYLDRQEETFGPDRVWSYRARSHLGSRAPGTATAVSLAVLLCGVVWIVAAAVTGEEGWYFGIFLAFMGGLFALVFWLMALRHGGPRVKGWERASLVISPAGMALVQGDLRGEMRWDELRDIKFNRGTGGFYLDHTAAGRGILLNFEGAQVLVSDIYDRPLNLIYKQMLRYWKG